MRDKGPTALVAVLLALVGLRVALPKGESKPEPPTPARPDMKRAAAAEGEEASSDTPRGPLLHFRSTGLEKSRPEAFPDVPCWDVRSLIVCVPDPIDSSSGDRFDSLVDAIQRAVETREYVLHDHYYPWPKQPPREEGSPRPQGTAAANGETAIELKATRGRLRLTFGPAKKDGPPYHSQPGVLLFRKRVPSGDPDPDKRDRLLLVFLVGETATTGVHKRAFATSLRLIAGSPEFKREPTVRVLGPYFSGSQVSLEQVIWGWANELGAPEGRLPDGRSLKVQIISGTATGIDRGKLQSVLPPPTVTFQATILPEHIVVRKLLVYANLAQEHGDNLEFKGDVAVLFESNTTFGHRAVRWRKDQSGKGRPVFFPFPLQISEVRAAYQQSTGPTRGDTIRLPSFGSKLHLPLDKSRGTRETEPALTPAMTTVMSERVLNTTLNTIAHDRFRYVLIVATDVKDVLFLATLVRSHCPHSRLLLCCNELLHTHPDFNPDLRGALVASTYPLYPRNQHWSFPFRGSDQRLAFPGQAEQGYYNAAVVLLFPRHPEALVEYGPPLPRPDDWTAQRKPPVWISIVGQGGVFPVAVFPAEDDGYVFQAQAVAGEAVFLPVHTTLWIVPVLALTLWLVYVVYAWFYVFSRRTRDRTNIDKNAPRLSQLLWPVSGGSQDSLRGQQRFCAAVCVGVVLLIYASVTAIWLIPPLAWLGSHSPVDMRGRWRWVMPVLLLCILLGVVVLLIASLAATLWRLRPRSWKAWLLSLRLRLWPVLRVWVPVLLLGLLLLVLGLDLLFLFVVLGLVAVALAALRWVWAQLVLAPVPAAKLTSPKPAGGRRWLSQLASRHPFLLLGGYVLTVLFTYLLLHGRHRPQPPRHGELLFFFDRATTLTNGVTPVVPVLLLGLAFFCWGYTNLRRIYLLRNHTVPNPFKLLGREEDIVKQDKEATADLAFPTRALASSGALVACFALYFTFCRLASGFVPSVEDVFTESILLLGLAVLSLFIVCGLLSLLKLWRSVRKLLQAIARKPLADALEHIPASITGLFGPYLSSQPPGRGGHLPAREERQQSLAADYWRIGKVRLTTALDIKDNRLDKLEAALPPKTPGPPLPSLAQTAKACARLLAHVWQRPWLEAKLLRPAEAPPAAAPTLSIVKTVGPTPPATGPVTSMNETVTPTDADKDIRDWLMRAQEFVALETVAYLNPFFFQLRNLLVFQITAPLLLLLAVSSYPFQPQRMWLLLGAVLVGVVVFTTIWILIQIERNEVLSRALDTTPHRLNFHWEFLGHFLLAAVPLLGVLIAVSGDFSDLVHAWLDPLFQLAK